ncbi:syntaxin-12 isoform X1 [Rattus norvegicus]|uniref:Syntaxin 12 n=1 Tax=Rattus norvegicus TaxID=10116 RepID=A0ABK0LX74_RAT|nr:syntaxin-12 isoform X1 [Rattus norvegicus]|eukprot:XP_006239128.1 PREDICTED: syntaxin-12 isoform X1 [Rattus norvegicus]
MSYGPLDMYRNPGPSGPQPRDFNSIIQTCSGNIQRISQATAQIKNLMSQLGTKQDSSKLQENLQQFQHSTNQLAKETNELLKELGSLPLPLSASEQRQQKLQKERLMNDFSSALNNFQVVQRKVSEKEKESIARARAGSRLSAEDRQREEQLVSFDSHEEWNQMQSQEEEAAITEQDLELIKERETAIQQLEADILDVNQIFKDLAMMIHDQGDLIDSIEANVESSEVHVERASDQLQRAAYYQDLRRQEDRRAVSSRPDWDNERFEIRLCFLFFFFFSFFRNWGPNPGPCAELNPQPPDSVFKRKMERKERQLAAEHVAT